MDDSSIVFVFPFLNANFLFLLASFLYTSSLKVCVYAFQPLAKMNMGFGRVLNGGSRFKDTLSVSTV